MNPSHFIEHLDQIFKDPQNISMPELEKLLFETLQFFDSIREKMLSKDLKEREVAMAEALEMQTRLNQVTEQIYAKTGLTKEKAQQILTNPANFKPEDWETMQNIEKELKQFQKHT